MNKNKWQEWLKGAKEQVIVTSVFLVMFVGLILFFIFFQLFAQGLI